MNLSYKCLSQVAAAAGLSMLCGAATAATSAYSVEHRFGFISNNWLSVVTPDVGRLDFTTFASANGLVDLNNGSVALPSGQGYLDNSHVSAGTAAADANSYGVFTSRAIGTYSRWWPTHLEYSVGLSRSYGWAFAADNTFSNAYAFSRTTLTIGDALWGRNGQLLWIPKVSGSTAGAATASSRNLRDPIDILWHNSGGELQIEQLLTIDYRADANDPFAVLDWDAEEGLLSFAAQSDAVFTIQAGSSWLSSSSQGSLSLQFDAQSGQYGLTATGQFAELVGGFNPDTQRYELNLGAIQLDYTAPTDVYAIRLGGSGDTLAAAVPEPSQWLMLLAGIGLLGCVAGGSRPLRPL